MLDVHPSDAQRFGLAAGNLACVESSHGSIVLPVRLSRDAKGQWQKDGVTGPADTATIQAFLNTLVTLRAERWLAPSAVPGNQAPVLTIMLRLRGADPGKAITLQLGPPADGGAHYGTVSNLNGSFLLGPREFAELERVTVAGNG